MGRIITTSAIAAVLLTAASRAQVAPAPAAPEAKPTAPATTAEKGSATDERTSSRYHLSDIDQHISGIASGFAIARHETDPFGLTQDPSKKTAMPKIVHATPRLRHIPPTPFKDVVAAIHVTAVLPSEQRFLVESRSIKRGDRFPILFRDKSVTVEVLRVSSSSITFQNVETKVVAKLVLDMVPPGMTRDAGGSAGPPGLERDNPSAPLELDVPSALPSSPPPAAQR